MAVKQTVAIIGATGNMGSALARSLATGPYRVLLFANDAAKLEALADEVRNRYPEAEVEAMGCPADACWEADIIIPAVPFDAEKAIAEKIKPFATGKVVISIANLPSEGGATEELQQLLPYAKVVGAFTNSAAGFDPPIIDGQKADVLIAGNDREAVETVNALVQAAGFNPVTRHASGRSHPRKGAAVTGLLFSE